MYSFIYSIRATLDSSQDNRPEKVKQTQYYETIIVIGTGLPDAKSTKYNYRNNFFLFNWPEISLKANIRENV
jgi:hypothetical protein